MANQIAVTSLKPPVSTMSRYADQLVIYYGAQNKLAYNTYKRKSYPLSSEDKFLVISKTREYRPDMVAYEQYGIVSLWWKLLEANGMKDIWDFKVGTNIRLPANIF